MSLLSRLAVQAARAYGILSSNKNAVAASYLAVAGGGGSGADVGGGGGAGGYQTSTFTLSILNTYSITVGAGGNGGIYSSSTAATVGNNSVISGTGLSTITSTGGGNGGIVNTSGGNGGSGGGGGGGGGSTTSGGTATSGQGNNGGSGAGGSNFGAGGGGGASAVGASRVTTTGGNGGAGTASSISGSSVTYAGGGGGGAVGAVGATPGTGGAGGGGNGSAGGAGSAGTANLGGGAGGGGNGKDGAAGGSGIVIISYTSATPKFVGGTLTTSGGNQIHTFTSSGTLSPITPITASYLVVAGGAGGGSNAGGGGGAGGLLTSSTTLYSGATYVVTVGGGGAGGASGGNNAGVNGSNSVLSGTGLTTLTSTGGGGGGKEGSPPDGNSGGSGGGGHSSGATVGAGGAGNTPSTSPSQGNNGGSGATNNATYRNGGGGGGASAVGATATALVGGNGGNGTASSISGSSVTYAGGGGGGSQTALAGGSGGTGGGGAGTGGGGGAAGGSGTTNLGGGGGGGAGGNGGGGAGGSGIVIISYAGSQAFNGGLVTTSGGNTIHTFTSTGALTPLTNNLTNSLRFRASASARLTRTFATTGTNNKIQTFSAWVKRGLLSSSTDYRLMGGYDGTSSNSTEINFDNDSLRIEFGGAANNPVITTQVFRDPSAWYHIVIAIDTTQATAANRIKMYVNGNQITAFSTATYPSQNALSQLTSANANNSIGSGWSGFEYFDGYMTDINFIDGQALEPYYFGNNDANGVWKPILYKGMYGTNGFYLPFSDTSALTTSSNVGLGKDFSNNGNYWATNNISITAGTTYDAMTDVPTNTSATVANYAVMNPLWTDGSVVIAQGNLNVSGGNYGGFSTLTIPTSSKFYAEFTVTATQGNQGVGILKAANAYSGVISQADMFGSNSVTYYSVNGNKFVLGGGSTAYGSSWGTIGDVIGIAVNTVDNQITFYKNNTSQGVITGLTSGIEWVFATGNQTSTGGGAWNFGQRPFSYTPPTGFVALNTFNLPTPTILQGNKYFDSTLYTQNGAASNVIVNQGQFKPDLVWIKCRSNSGTFNNLVDSVRGVSSALFSNSTAAQDSYPVFSSFNSNGFTLPLGDTGTNSVSGRTQVAWQWQAGQSSGSSNTAGSITSTVSVSTTAGFSVVTYTGTGANATVGHGLGVAPRMIIVKNRVSVTDWAVYHASVGNTGALRLNLTAATETDSRYWNNTTPTSTVFSVGSSSTVNGSSNTQVAYCWAEIAGFSALGSYVGNGSTNGPFIYTGFRPEFILVKNTQAAQNWRIVDTSRSPYNQTIGMLEPSSSAAEYTDAGNSDYDILSNGFKIRNTGGMNNNNETHIFMAFAENPFKNANAR
jgi:hypothetical protein